MKQKESLRSHLKTPHFPLKHSLLPDSKVHENTDELEEIVLNFNFEFIQNHETKRRVRNHKTSYLPDSPQIMYKLYF